MCKLTSRKPWISLLIQSKVGHCLTMLIVDYNKAWINLLNHSHAMLQMIQQIYEMSQSEDNSKFTLQTVPDEKLKAVEKYLTVQEVMKLDLLPKLGVFATFTINKCQEVKKALKSHRDIMTKRNHKKIDYDRQLSTVEKARKVENKSEKQLANLQIMEAKLVEVTDIFQAYDKRIVECTPLVIGQFGQFMGPVMESIILEHTSMVESVQMHISAFVEQQKMDADSFTKIVNTFRSQFDSVKDVPERNLIILQDYDNHRRKNVI